MDSTLLIAGVSTFGLVLVVLLCANLVAPHVGLVDHPDDERKLHKGSVPLTGGIAILLSLAAVVTLSGVGLALVTIPDDFWITIVILLAVLVFAHALDDIKELNALVRLAIDGALGLLLCTVALLQINSLGDLFGQGELTLGRWAVPMTLFSLIAASNAFNMTDGIDSLCSGFGLIAFATIIMLLNLANGSVSTDLIDLCLLSICALSAAYAANLGILGSKLHSFLGDSGARLIGFIVAIVIIFAVEEQYFPAVYAFFPIAIPVCDCLILMAVRLAQGRSPFSADRRHLHHLLLDLGFSTRLARQSALVLGVFMSAIGLMLFYSGTAEWIVSVVVVVLFAGYIGLRLLLTKLIAAQPLVESSDAQVIGS